MKIDAQELRRLYQAAIRQRKPPSPKRCPPARKMIGLFNNTLSAGERARVVDHITGCGPCYEAFESYRSLFQQQEEMIASLEAWVDRRREKARRPSIKDKKGTYHSPPRTSFWGSLASKPWVQTIGGALVVLGVILALSQWTPLKNIFENRYRAAQGLKIVLINPPPHRSVLRQSLVFEWAPRPTTEYYIFELFDEALVPVWKSPETTRTNTVLPRDVAGRLRPLQPYYWLVTGMLADGKKAESDIGVFFIKRS